VVSWASHVDYTAWASMRLTEACAGLTPDELTRDFGTADKSVLRTLVHVFGADRVWLARVEGRTPEAFLTEADHDLAVLQLDWPEVLEGWKRWVAGLDEAALNGEMTYRDLKGREWRNTRWQIVAHVVNHATHHRGQVAGFLRAMGKKPPVLDEIAFFRERL